MQLIIYNLDIYDKLASLTYKMLQLLSKTNNVLGSYNDVVFFMYSKVTFRNTINQKIHLVSTQNRLFFYSYWYFQEQGKN